MTNATDERRALVLRNNLGQQPYMWRDVALSTARASDAEAGMVLVSKVVADSDEPMSWHDWLRIAAHEGDE